MENTQIYKYWRAIEDQCQTLDQTERPQPQLTPEVGVEFREETKMSRDFYFHQKNFSLPMCKSHMR